MLATTLVVALVATALAFLAALAGGRRPPRWDGALPAAGLAVPGALVAGEVAARAWRLPSGQALAAEAVLVGATVAVALARPRWSPRGAWLFATFLVAAVAYLAVAAEATVAGGLAPVPLLTSAALWLLEAAGLALAASFAFEACDVVCRTRWDRRPGWPPPGDVAGARPPADQLPFVSVHVAAYNEPPDMLIETIRSIEALDHPHLEVVVVDNNTEDADVWKPVEEYCADRPWVRFVHVAPWPGYKAGALNLALEEHTDPRAELIAVVDADYLVDPAWLRDLVGWFDRPIVAFVQCPQDYDEWEGDAYLTACHDSYAYFFAASMRSRHERNSAIFGGTMGIVRRSALEEVGGWDEWCITEDAELSLRLYAAGYQGVYVHRSYGRGIMPLTFDALKRQRFRWCFGGMQILRRHARLLLPGRRADDDALTARQRLDFLVSGLQWGADLVALGCALVLLASAVAMATGGTPGFRPLGGPAVALPLALAVTGTWRALWALRVVEGVSWRRACLALATWMALSLTVAQAVARGLVQRDGVFLRTPKWRHDGGLVEALRATRAESALAAALVVAGGVAAVAGAPAVAGLALWQALTYAAAPTMAWLNLHTELSARLQRRQRSEGRRERLAAVEEGLARVAVVALAAACIAGVALVAHYPGDGSPPGLPQRGDEDAGPLGNLGLAPDVGRSGAPAPAPPAPLPTTAPAGGDPAAPGDATGPGAPADGTAPTTAAPTTAPTTTTTTTLPPGNDRPTTPDGPGRPPDAGPPTSRPGGR